MDCMHYLKYGMWIRATYCLMDWVVACAAADSEDVPTRVGVDRGGDRMFLGSFFLWLGIGMVLGLVYAVIRYGVPVLVTGVAVIFGIARDCSKAFVKGLREG